MGAPTHGPKTGKDGQETGKEKGHAVRRGLGWLVLERFGVLHGEFGRVEIEV